MIGWRAYPGSILGGKWRAPGSARKCSPGMSSGHPPACPLDLPRRLSWIDTWRKVESARERQEASLAEVFPYVQWTPPSAYPGSILGGKWRAPGSAGAPGTVPQACPVDVPPHIQWTSLGDRKCDRNCGRNCPGAGQGRPGRDRKCAEIVQKLWQKLPGGRPGQARAGQGRPGQARAR